MHVRIARAGDFVMNSCRLKGGLCKLARMGKNSKRLLPNMEVANQFKWILSDKHCQLNVYPHGP